MADRTAVTPITSVAPGLHPCPEPGQGQLTRPGEVAYVSMGPTWTPPLGATPPAHHPRAQPAPDDGPDAHMPGTP
jgi:hypothetical protein